VLNNILFFIFVTEISRNILCFTVLHKKDLKWFSLVLFILVFVFFSELFFFNHRLNTYKLTSFSHNIWKGRLVNTVIASVNTLLEQMREMSCSEKKTVSESHEWSAVPIFTCLHHGTHGCFRSGTNLCTLHHTLIAHTLHIHSSQKPKWPFQNFRQEALVTTH